MKHLLIPIFSLFFTLSSSTGLYAETVLATTANEIKNMANAAEPGDTIIVKNGIYPDAQISITVNGTQANPIVIIAETPGEVKFTGISYFNFAGSFLELNGLNWEEVDPPYAQIISSKNGSNYAYDCIIRNCSMLNCNPADPLENFKWIKLYGRRHLLENNSFHNKTNMGMTLSIYPDDTGPGENIVRNNYFGVRPPVEGQTNGLETIQIGQSHNDMPGNNLIEDNYFYACDGEVELISVKLDGNIIRNNVIKECAGGIVLRMGHDNLIESNIFLGENKLGTAGIRLHGYNQKILNNYFIDLNMNSGSEQNYPIALMLGDADPENQSYYYPIENCTIAYNTIYHCNRGISAGEDLSGQTVAPTNTWIANNVVLVDGDKCIKYITPQDDLMHEGNILFRPDGGTLTDESTGYIEIDPDLQMASGDSIWRVHASSPLIDAGVGNYSDVIGDFESQSRPNPDAGADELSDEESKLNITVGPNYLLDNCVSDDILNLHGYAKIAGVTGGNGQQAYVINNTNDSGPGSYREALSQSNRYITFDPSLAGAVIALNSPVNTSASNITLTGFDAPGVTISNYATKFEGDNYVISYLQFFDMDATSNEDCLTFRNAPVNGQKFYLYKCHFKNATDGSVDVIWNQGNDVYGTISHCKFEHTDKNFLVHSGDASMEGGFYYLTFDHNWFYKTGQRNPLARHAHIHHYNNLMEDWGGLNNNGSGAYAGYESNYLVQNDIAIAALPGDLNWEYQPIELPKTKAFAPALGETSAIIKSEGNWYQNGAYHINQSSGDVFDPPYSYTLQEANNDLEFYLRNYANAESNMEDDCVGGVPDLTTILIMLPTAISGVSDVLFKCSVNELNGFETDGLITVLLPKDNRFSFVWDPQQTTLINSPINNSLWNYDSSNPAFHIWTSSAYMEPFEKLDFGFVGIYDPQSTTGQISYTVTILTGSGSEENGLNNIDAETLYYFSN